jgi:mRNA interferase HigB
MRIISKSRLRAFWQRAESREAEGPLAAWHTHVSSKTVAWRTWSDIKVTFATASHVGHCVVFNIGGNKYRLITRVLYPSQKVFILKVMTHTEYDENKWQDECGCFRPPPRKPARFKPPRNRKN